METALNLSTSQLGQVTDTISDVFQNNDFDNVAKIVKKEHSIDNDTNSDGEQAIPSELVEIEVTYIKQEPVCEEICENEPFKVEPQKSPDSISNTSMHQVNLEYKFPYCNIDDEKEMVPIFYPRVVPSTSTSILPEVAALESGSPLRRSTRNRQKIKVKNTFAETNIESNEVKNCFQNFLNTTFNDDTHSVDDKTQVLSGIIDENLTNFNSKKLGQITTNLEDSLLTVTNKETSKTKQKKKRGRGQKLTFRKRHRSDEYLEIRKQKSREAHRKKREEMRKLEAHIKNELNNLGFPELISQHKNASAYVLPQKNQEPRNESTEHATNGFCNVKDEHKNTSTYVLPQKNQPTDESTEHATNGLCRVKDDSVQDQLSRLMAEWQKILDYRARVRDNARNRRRRLKEKGNKRQLEEYRAKCRAYMRKKRANQEFRELEKHRDKIKARERRQQRSLIDELIKPGSCGVDINNEKNSNPLEILQQINFSTANIQSGLLAALNRKLSRPKSKQEELAKTYERRNNNPEYKRQSRMNRLQRYFGFPSLVRGRKRCSLCCKYFEIAYNIVQVKKQRSKGKKTDPTPKKRGRPKKEIADDANSKEVVVNEHESAISDEDDLCSDYTLGKLDRQLRMVQLDLEVKCTCQFRDLPEDKTEAERNEIRKMILSKQIEVVKEQISGITRSQCSNVNLKSNFSFRDKEREKAKRRARQLRKRKYSNTSECSEESVKIVSDDSETDNAYQNASDDGTGDFHNFLFQKVDIGTFEVSTNESQTDPIGISDEVDASFDTDAHCQAANSESGVVEASPITSLGIEYVKKRREAERKKKARQRKEARLQKSKKSMPEREGQDIVNLAERLDDIASRSETIKRTDDVSVEPPKIILLEFD